MEKVKPIKPIKPSEVKSTLTPAVISAVNDLIIENWEGNQATFTAKQVFRRSGVNHFSRRLLMEVYFKGGWDVIIVDNEGAEDSLIFRKMKTV